MDVRSLGYRTDLALLRLGGTSTEDRGDHLIVRSVHNPAHRWGNFLLLDGVPSRDVACLWLRRFDAAFPGAEHVTMGFDGTDGDVDDLSWFAEGGFDVEAQTVMTSTIACPPAHHNDSAVYRRLSSDDDWAQSVQLRLRCQAPVGRPEDYCTCVTKRAKTNRELVDAGHGQWFGAFMDNRLISQMGLLLAGHATARFQSVETDPRYRRQGLAGSLLYYVSCYGLEKLAANTLVIVADPNYVAVNLYRAAGFNATEVQLQAERTRPSATTVSCSP